MKTLWPLFALVMAGIMVCAFRIDVAGHFDGWVVGFGLLILCFGMLLGLRTQ